MILFEDIGLFHSIKNKNANKNLTPQRLLVRKCFWQAQEETTFALKNPRIAFCYRVKGLTLCHECNYEHAGLGPVQAWFRATQQPSHQAPFSHSQGKQTRVV